MVSYTQPGEIGGDVTITPVAQGRNQGVGGHLLPSPYESEGGREWPVPGWFQSSASPLAIQRMEPALLLRTRTFKRGSDGESQHYSTWRDLRIMEFWHILSRGQNLRPKEILTRVTQQVSDKGEA